MPYIFGKLWHLAIIWAIRKSFQCILQGVRFLLAIHTGLSPTSENESYIDIHPSLFGDNLATLPHKKIGTVNYVFLGFTKSHQYVVFLFFRVTQIPSLQNGFTHFSNVLPTRLLNVLRKKIFTSQRLNHVYRTVQVLKLLLSNELSLEGVLSECWIKRLPSCNQVGLGHYIWKVQ